MVHISGIYSVRNFLGFDITKFGGSLGCFGFIPESDIYSNENLALNAYEDYDNETSNADYQTTVVDVINNLISREQQASRKKLEIQVIKRTDYQRRMSTKDKVFNYDETTD